jgi:hypothetical protein
MDVGDFRCILMELHSVLLIPDEDDGVVRAFHPSWHDFLVTPIACRNDRFFINAARQHGALAILCFERIERATETGGQRLQEDAIPGDLEYAARHWLAHVTRSVLDEDTTKTLRRFDPDHVTAWLSVLSRIGRVADAIHEVKGALLWLQVSPALFFMPHQPLTKDLIFAGPS